ncbi:hypothetical protein HYS50_03235 [Candidatus Woesearchaeota archaeon]|nr:hypothetical protein [Candidatus Woesearchaeota archaeon]
MIDLTCLTTERKPYGHYLAQLREKKKKLDTVKIEIDRVTGSWSSLWGLFGKEKTSLRELVDAEIALLGDISESMDEMANQYGGEREQLLHYFDTLATRLEKIQAYQPADLAPLEQPKDALSLLRSMRARMDHQFHEAVKRRLAVTERNTKQYADEAVRLIEQCQAAHTTFVAVAEALRYEHEHLQATGPAHVSLIELAETSKVVGKAMLDVRETSNTMYRTVNQGYAQVLGMIQQHRVPLLQGNGRKIELLRG